MSVAKETRAMSPDKQLLVVAAYAALHGDQSQGTEVARQTFGSSATISLAGWLWLEEEGVQVNPSQVRVEDL
jgi:hypothetical protein